MPLNAAIELQTLMVRAMGVRSGLGALWASASPLEALARLTSSSEACSSHCWSPPQPSCHQGHHQLHHTRSYAKGKGGSKPAAKEAPAPPKAALEIDPKLDSPLRLLNRRFPYTVEPTSLVSPEDKQTVTQHLLPQAAASTSDADAQTSAELSSFKQLGVPLSPRDVVQLMHTSMSRATGENVHLRHFVYNSLFQSAAGVAQYVAAGLEAGTAWPRIERFFLSCVEDDRALVAAIKIQVRGRFGRKAGMASRKIWEQGSLKLGELSCPVDYGAAHAFTRVGMLGVKVWIRYKPGVAAGGVMHRQPGTPPASLLQLLSTPRAALPVSDACASTGWWGRSGPQQPAAHLTWKAFKPDFDPTTDSVSDYLDKQKPLLFRNNAERVSYLQTSTLASRKDEGTQPDK